MALRAAQRFRQARYVTVSLFWLSVTTEAHAHAPPEATGVYFPADSKERVFVRTNRGIIVVAPDRVAAPPALLCNDAFHASLVEVAPVLPTATSLLLGSYAAGLLTTSPDMCSITQSSLPLGDRRLVALTSGAGTYALGSATDEAFGVLFASTDGGANWEARTTSLGFGTAVSTAPSNPDRIYVSQQTPSGDQLANELSVSDDGGRTFSVRSVPLTAQEVRPFVVAVDPLDAERVFVRTLAASPELPERLLLSEDGGVNFHEVASATGPLTFTIDSELAYLGFAGGVRRSSDRGLSFSPLANAPTHVGCVTSRANELYVCGFAHDEFAVWRSRDQGGSFASYLRFSEVTDGVACPALSPVSTSCAAAVADWKEEHPPASEGGEAGRGSTTGSKPDSAGCQLHGTAKHAPATPLEGWLFLAVVSLVVRLTARRSNTLPPHRRL